MNRIVQLDYNYSALAEAMKTILCEGGIYCLYDCSCHLSTTPEPIWVANKSKAKQTVKPRYNLLRLKNRNRSVFSFCFALMWAAMAHFNSRLFFHSQTQYESTKGGKYV